MKAVILAGGKGTRLAPYTKILPKPLMPIGDMPVLEVLIRQIKREGVDEVILTVGHLAELLQAFFNNGKSLGVEITYSIEDEPLGTAGPLSLVRDRLTETFLVMNGDVLTTLKVGDLVRFHKEQGGIATIAMHRRHVKVDLGVIQLNGGQIVQDYIEKPTYDFSVSMGIYVFEPRVLDYIPHGEYLDFPNLVHRLLDAGEKVVGYQFEGYWQDLGRPDDYEQAAQDFEKMRSEFLPED
ncbi:MAG TPA: NTP transferase domain-containing protein [Chloroflexi bacterium]|jgi:NDP-sugar pyrophosphorylase family protein|nr:NTP transferase domain-containing protein [Chloroflexota bacterium]HPO57602.1 sugar phosphate nucleotidyltransferase [Anaerolineaceae bacterium]